MIDTHDDRQAVYEIGYLIVDSVTEENLPAEAEKIKKIITDAGASVIAEEMPHNENLAYTMRRKTVSGSYENYDRAYFGWVKFELPTAKIEAVKKAVEVLPSVLRMLITTTVRENTYLGKRAPAIAAAIRTQVVGAAPLEKIVAPAEAPAAPVATIEEMDKSIDDMVKEV